MKRKVTITICILVFLVALTMTIFPLLSNFYNQKHHAKMYTKYNDNISNSSSEKLVQERAKAIEYNNRLLQGALEESEYNNILNLAGDGVMGYVNVPKLEIRLPIYHTTEADVLEIGAGHMSLSSLPVGGENTHCAISAHSGMASQKMFSDIDMLVVGDVFYIDVLGEKLYYSIYEISVVLPYETQNIQIEKGKDKCSLITCTPFGVNTHRLIVTAERIEVSKEQEIQEINAGNTALTSTWEREYKKAIIIGACAFLAILMFCVLFSIVRKNQKDLRKEDDSNGN